MRFAKKHNKKGLKKMQANNAKALSARAEAIKALGKPKEVKPKIPKGGSRKLRRLAYIAHPKLGKQARARTAKGLRLCRPKAKGKAQTKAPAGNKPLDVAQVSSHRVEKLLRLRELSGTSELQLRLLEGGSGGESCENLLMGGEFPREML
ncbi:hypothetical protein mRhiFer1_009547 [Rhinolophus ferrumequinum]|uniref:60S ribosomal protein L29 n=1 Tax=Rhinolophus ferrumequinum TaxID=59479 RepID=A0A7J7R8A9_RHIFE|nr:hypothetical protein mRhiFer1_009547 [Rhinolophus ferrumequinum]